MFLKLLRQQTNKAGDYRIYYKGVLVQHQELLHILFDIAKKLELQITDPTPESYIPEKLIFIRFLTTVIASYYKKSSMKCKYLQLNHSGPITRSLLERHNLINCVTGKQPDLFSEIFTKYSYLKS